MMKNVLLLSLISVAFVGCETTKVTNLTPTKMERNPEGTYTIEAAWQTREHAIRTDSLKPQVMVGLQAYPMKRTPVVRDRWEANIPVAADKNSVYYRFKFDYQYNSIPVPRPNSKLSPEYKLEIVDKK